MGSNIPFRCGLHVSIVGTIDQAVDRARGKDCDTFQIFTRNPRSWKFKVLDHEEITQFKNKLSNSRMMPVAAHMPYLANLACPKQSVYEKSVRALIEELNRCDMLGIPYIVTHLGSHLGKGRETGLERLINAMAEAFNSSKGKSTILLENTAGTTNSMGSTFEDIQEIIDRIAEKSRVAICFDTCHAFTAGYDLRDVLAVEKTLDKLRKVVELDLIRIVHANDSKSELASRIDRHEHIGMGHIGYNGFKAILHNDAFRRLPFILETPIDRRGSDTQNLKTIRRLAA
nr:deoxyribonuclease IV [Candidatus Njordarchaeum guaymaensis]